jgi:hypothetical protein
VVLAIVEVPVPVNPLLSLTSQFCTLPVLPVSVNVVEEPLHKPTGPPTVPATVVASTFTVAVALYAVQAPLTDTARK